MRKTISFKEGNKTFDTNLAGFIEAVSFLESSSNLLLPLNHPINIKAAGIVNGPGFLGLFQWGEEGLYDLGYYLGDKGISYADIKGVDKKSTIYKNWKNQFSSNNWVGKWSGKRNINSKSDFLKNPQAQYEIIKEWIKYLCNQLRNNNFNEHFGRTIQGVEITESGAIAGMHLVGIGGLGAFLEIPKFKGQKQIDGNKTHIKRYIEDFGSFDLEQCCNRKIYVSLTDKNKNILANKEVTIVSNYTGKGFSGETKVKLKSDENGNLPVVVRHPNTEIKIIADGKESNSIIQKANEKQKAILSDFNITNHPATLEKDNTPQPRPQVNKTPQDIRNEQAQSSNASETESTIASKDVNLNIQIVEGDSGKPISNMNFFLTYKGNIKKHTADGGGVKQGVVAEEGQDIEVSVEGSGQKQVIHHFRVSGELKNKTVKVNLPVYAFNILVMQDGKPVPNTLFSIFYRGREIPKRTNNQGIINVRMLTGFVFGFGIKGKSLVLSRVEKASPTTTFTVNGNAVQASKLYEIADAKQKQAEDLKNKQKQKEIQENKAKQEAEKAKTEASQKNQAKQNNTYTENGGKPLTTVSDQAATTSDTTNYVIYSNGTIDRTNKAASGYAAYYYVVNNQPVLIGKSKIYKADRWSKKGKKGSGTSYLVNIREIFGDTASKPNNTWEKKIGNLNISIRNDSQEQHRFWLSTEAFAAYIGAVCNFGEKVRFSGFSDKNGSPGKSSSHLNGEVGDIGYIRVDRNNAVGVNFEMAQYDHDASLRFVNILISFGWGKTKNMLSEYYPNHLVNKYKLNKGYILPRCSEWTNPRHNNHLHLQGLAVTFNKDE
ncbi:cell envelope integrity protein TolA [Acinetobacter guillouiae]|uniref:cell envelope integrity protein TolA n=1 Tax=Acinetobacter guillouiae TaxID=106649 RepID=UPI0028D816FE|nr:cell envelope integrity protein TolA [Acinetobacter guillouiae]